MTVLYFHMIITFQASIIPLTVDFYIISTYLVLTPVLRWDKWYQTCILMQVNIIMLFQFYLWNFISDKKINYYFSGSNYPHEWLLYPQWACLTPHEEENEQIHHLGQWGLSTNITPTDDGVVVLISLFLHVSNKTTKPILFLRH